MTRTPNPMNTEPEVSVSSLPPIYPSRIPWDIVGPNAKEMEESRQDSKDIFISELEEENKSLKLWIREFLGPLEAADLPPGSPLIPVRNAARQLLNERS